MSGDGTGAEEVLRQIARLPGTGGSWNLAIFLPEIARSAIRIGRPEIGRELASGVDDSAPYRRRGLAAAEALLLEADGRHEEAAKAFADVASEYGELGFVYEAAMARLGEGRCLVALGRSGSEEPLRKAREFFAGVRATPFIAECDDLLGKAVALSS